MRLSPSPLYDPEIKTVSDKGSFKESLDRFPAQKVQGTSNQTVLDLPCLLGSHCWNVSKQKHVDTSLIHIESRKSPTKSLFDAGSSRISIFIILLSEPPFCWESNIHYHSSDEILKPFLRRKGFSKLVSQLYASLTNTPRTQPLADDIAVQSCFFDIQLTSLSPRNCITSRVLLRSIGMRHVIGHLKNAVKIKARTFGYQSPIFVNVPLKYREIFNLFECFSVGLA
ncbi:hypothetical protein Tco_1533812 [Tanacetum coccineum]